MHPSFALGAKKAGRKHSPLGASCILLSPSGPCREPRGPPACGPSTPPRSARMAGDDRRTEHSCERAGANPPPRATRKRILARRFIPPRTLRRERMYDGPARMRRRARRRVQGRSVGGFLRGPLRPAVGSPSGPAWGRRLPRGRMPVGRRLAGKAPRASERCNHDPKGNACGSARAAQAPRLRVRPARARLRGRWATPRQNRPPSSRRRASPSCRS